MFLSGEIPNQDALDKVIKLAKKTEGVKTVKRTALTITNRYSQTTLILSGGTKALDKALSRRLSATKIPPFLMI